MTATAVPTGSIGRKAARGLRWSLLGMLVTRMGSFAMALVLARLLAPSDFGTYAVALAATQFAMHIKDVGVIAATVHWRGDLDEMAPTATTLTLVFSTALYGAVWITAPWFSALSGTPQATPVVRLLTAVILVEGVTAVRSGALMRAFEQDRLTLANMLGFVVNATLAISLAATGAGAFSFAWGQLAGSVVTGVLLVVLARIPIGLGLDFKIAGRLLRFGVPLAAGLGIEAILINSSYVIVGNFTGATELGYYLLAFNISSWVPGVIGTAIRYVSVAGFSRLSEGPAEPLSAGVQRSAVLLVTGLVPIAVLMATLAGPLVSGLYGAQWAPAAPVLRFLVALTVVRMLVSFAQDIMMGTGATRSTLWVNLGWAVALLPALVVGTRFGGIGGAAISHAVVGVLVAVPLAMLALHRLGMRVTLIAPRLVRPALAGVLAAGVALLAARITGPHPLVQLCVAGSAGLLAYVVAAVKREQLHEWATILRRKEAHGVE